MDKLNCEYPLNDIKELIKKGKIVPNLRVIESANKLKFSETEVYEIILNLQKDDFYKSTTTYHNHRIWQDVYKKAIKNLPIYIKFQITGDGFLIRSFKRDESA